MSKKFLSMISVLLIAAFVLAACAPAATEAPAPTTAPAAPAQPTAAAAEPTAAPAEPTAAPAEPTVAAPAEGGVTGNITLWHSWKETEIASLNEVVAAFQAKNPDVKFDILYVPPDDLRGKFETAASTGGGPTVLIGSADWGPAFYKAALVADLTGMINDETVANINPAALGAVQYDGALIGMPQTLKGVLLFRNKSIIPEPATDVDDMLAKAKAATQGDVQGLDFEYGLFFSAAHLTALGGSLLDEMGDPTFNDETGVEWVNMLKKIKDAGVPMENNNDNDVNLFKTGKAGWIIDGSWNMSALAEAIGKDNLVIDPWPAGMSGYAQTEDIFLSANATEDDAAAGAAFIEFFMSPEAQTLLADPTKAAHIPAINGVEVTDPLMQQAVEGFAGGTAFPVIPEMGAYWDPANNALKAVITDNKDPETELQAANDLVIAKIEEIRKQ